MIKLKNILSEAYAWEREPGKPLPTLEQTTAAYAAKMGEQSAEQPLSNPMETPLKESDDIFDEIADELGISSEEFDSALNKSMAELDIIEKIYMSDHYTKAEAMSMIADMLDVDINEAADGVKPDFLDLDDDGDETESMKSAAADSTNEYSSGVHADGPKNANSDVRENEQMIESFNKRMLGNLHGHEYILREAFKRK